MAEVEGVNDEEKPKHLRYFYSFIQHKDKKLFRSMQKTPIC